MGITQYPLSENFLRYFDVSCAVTDAEKSKVYGIRYSVYCDEFQYESADLFPDREEKDEFDANSLHALVTHKSSGLAAGCVRLVSPTGSGGQDPLPFEKHCADSLDHAFVNGLALDRSTLCEISRLAVHGTFRRRAGEKITRYGEVDGLDTTKQESRTFSLIALACFLAAAAMGEVASKTAAFAMMEPFLPRLVKRSGIKFQRAGEDINYHGLRAPYFITLQAVLDDMRPDLRELYDEIHLKIKNSYR